MGKIFPNGRVVPLSVESFLVLDNVSIAAAGSVDSAQVDTDYVRRARVVINAAGADVTVNVQASADGGATWHEHNTYAAGATGIQAVVELLGPLTRVGASNGGLTAQSVTAYLVLES